MRDALLSIHLLAAATWIGGTIALVFAGVPAIRQLEGEARAATLRELGRRWRPLGWGALAVLLASGLILANRDGLFGRALLWVKLGLVAALAATSYLHDYVLGPALARQIKAREPETVRPRLVAVGWTTFGLTLIVPVLGVILVETSR